MKYLIIILKLKQILLSNISNALIFEYMAEKIAPKIQNIKYPPHNWFLFY